MTRFNLASIFLCLFMINICNGFNFIMDRSENLVKNQTYCGRLQCQVDTVSDTNLASLIKMDIFYFKTKQLLATILPEMPQIQHFTGNNTIIIGSMSMNHGEMHVYFSDVSNCSETAFVCKIQYKNSTNGKADAEKYILPINSDQNEANIYVKSQMSMEQKIFDQSGIVMEKLKPYTSFRNEGMGFQFTFGRLINSNEISKQQNKPEVISWENAGNNFEQKLSDFEVKIRKQLDAFMEQMSTKIEGIKSTQKEMNSNLKDVTQKEIIRIREQSISDFAQSHNDPKLTILERRMDDMIDQVNVSLNFQELRTHTCGLEIIQKLDFLMVDSKLIGLNVSSLEIKLTEIQNNVRQMKDTTTELLKNDRHMKDKMTELLKNERQMNDTMKEIIKNEGQMNETMKKIQHCVNNINKHLKEGELMLEIQQSLTLLYNNLNHSKLLNIEVTMGEIVREMQYNNLTMNDWKQSVNDKCNGDVIRNKTDQRMSSLVDHLEELRINQGSLETLLIHVTGSLNKYYTSGYKQLQSKCERGMIGLLGPRLITSLENKKQVLCDTVTDGGGWIIIQRRVNGKVNFTRNWNDYKNGFGSLDGDFWIGNELISNITSKEIYTLRIDMRQGSNAYRAEYDSFMLKNESDNYRLHLGVFSGNINNSLSYHNNMAFSTPDRDNDMWNGVHCAHDYQTGWWYNACRHSHLNGVWGLNTDRGMYWLDHSVYKFLNFVEMKIRLK